MELLFSYQQHSDPDNCYEVLCHFQKIDKIKERRLDALLPWLSVENIPVLQYYNSMHSIMLMVLFLFIIYIVIPLKHIVFDVFFSV